MTPKSPLRPVFRWGVLLWLLVWVPVNLQAWGWQNMMHFCDVGAVIACLGIFMQRPLLFSSQAVGSLFVGVLWSLDIAWRLVTGHHLVGGTEYMWDEHYALWIRLFSTFHIGLPLVLLWAMRNMGYDRRALALQSAITAVLLIFSRFLAPELNMNYAFRDPLFHRAWGPAPVHLAIILAGTVVLLYWPTHVLLAKTFMASAPSEAVPGSVVQENE
jgi:hypothetical protein